MIKFIPTPGLELIGPKLSRVIKDYFIINKIDIKGDYRLYTKAIILITLLGITHVLLLYPHYWIISLILSALRGLLFALIGFNIMHDGSHGSFSNSNFWNKLAASTLDLLGPSSFFWNLKHNINHHTDTNTVEDDDIDLYPLFYIKEKVGQKRLWFHQYQHRYAIVLYSLLYIAWIGPMDLKKYFKGKVAGKKFTMSFGQHIFFWFTKTLFVFNFIYTPYVFLGESSVWDFLTSAFVCGIAISVIFQLAHVQEKVAFPVGVISTKDPSIEIIENEWFRHQLKTTANFAIDNKVWAWLLGGLNFQVEHHCFKNISHVHYSKLSPLLQEFCKDNGIQYLVYPTFTEAYRSHINFLRFMGKEPKQLEIQNN